MSITSRTNSLQKMRVLLTDRLDYQDIRNICFDLDIKYDDIPGEAIGDKVRELLMWTSRRKIFEDLFKNIIRIRPDLSDDLQTIINQMIQVCTSCGNTSYTGALYCSKCGNPLTRSINQNKAMHINVSHFEKGIWHWNENSPAFYQWISRRITKQDNEEYFKKWSDFSWESASSAYREDIERRYNQMQVLGMSTEVPITDIFTDVYVLDQPSAWQRHDIDKLWKQQRSPIDESLSIRRIDGLSLVRKYPRLLILGQPGAGKTTFLKYLAMQAIEGHLDVIPVFVSLKGWSDENIELLPFISQQFRASSLPDVDIFVEYILEVGKVLFLFDGLDEVNVDEGKRYKITSSIRQFTQRYMRCRVVITCRTAATEYIFEQFRYCELADFTQEQMEVFVARWYSNSPKMHTEFMRAFFHEENRGLRDMARRPLLLTMLCLTFNETMSFPKRRGELYNEAIDVLLKKWDASRYIQRDVVYKQLSTGYKRQLFMEIAAQTFDAGQFYMLKTELSKKVARFLSRIPNAGDTKNIDGDDVLRSIEAHHGLLIERSQGIYSFSHLSFHEYFTACYIAEHPEIGVFEGAINHSTDSQWREVLLLTSSMLDHRNSQSFFRIWINHLNTGLSNDPKVTQLLAPTSSLKDEQGAFNTDTYSNAKRLSHILVNHTKQKINQIENNIQEEISYVVQFAREHTPVLFSDDSTEYSDAYTYLLSHKYRSARSKNKSGIIIFNRAFDLATAYSSPGDRTLVLALQCAQELADAIRNTDPLQDLVGRLPDIVDEDSLRSLSSDIVACTTRIDKNIERAIEIIKPVNNKNGRSISKRFSVDYLRILSNTQKTISELIDFMQITFNTLSILRQIQSFNKAHLISSPQPEHEIYYITIDNDEMITKYQLEKLRDYTISTLRLLECIEMATIEGRESIKRSLLVYPIAISDNTDL